MRRTTVALVVLMTLLTGITLGKTGDVLNGASPVVVRNESASVQPVADRFYSAVNYFLATGSSETLQDVLNADFRDHLQGQPEGRSENALLDDLRMIRAEFPNLQLSHRAISLDGNTGVFSVTRLGDPPENDSGIPPGVWPDQETIEVIQVSGTSIAERWSSRKESWRFDEFIESSWHFETPQVSVPTIERFTFDPGAELKIENHTGLILVAETAGLTIDVSIDQKVARYHHENGLYVPETPAESGHRTLLQGEVTAIPPATAFTLSNSLDQQAEALMMQVDPNLIITNMILGPPNPLVQALPDGISLNAVASGGYIDLSSRVNVAFGHLTLVPGATLPPYETLGVQLIVPISGEIEVHTFSGIVQTRSANMIDVLPDDRILLVEGDGLCADTGSILSVKAVADEPASAWVLTFIPPEDKKTHPEGSPFGTHER